MTEAALLVVAVDEQADIMIDLARWQRLATCALRASGVERGELNLLFIDESAMTELNREHMGENRPTDVLSFPLDGAAGADLVGADLIGDVLIGDVVVCPAYAERQAAAHSGDRGHDGSTADELALLIVHGVLHVLGHDHAGAAETIVMKAREQQLLDAHHRR
jgi:probable rRNA maturation factor